MKDFLVDFATRISNDKGCRFQLDDGRLLVPSNSEQCSGENDQRVILNYSMHLSDTIHINSVTDIFTGSLFITENKENLYNDPVFIQSIWCSGDYLNMILKIEYHSQPHKVGLYRDITSQTTDLWFSYSRNDDPRGYQKKLYLSFLLNSLRKDKKGPTDFRLFIQTHKGLRTFHFTLPE